MTEPMPVTVHLAFAFDIGDEIDLEPRGCCLQGEPGQLPRRRRTPESIGYRPAPIRVDARARPGIALPGDWSVCPPAWRADAVRLRRDLAGRPVSRNGELPRALLELAGRLAEPALLTEAARRLLAPWLERIAPVGLRLRRQRDQRGIHRLPTPGTALAAGSTTAPTGSPDWFGWNRSRSARARSAEATRLSLSYTPNDLVVLDWAAGLVADPDCADTSAGHRVRERPAPGVSPHRRPARRPPRGRLPADPPRTARVAGRRVSGGCTATRSGRSASSRSRRPASSNGSTTPSS